MKRVFFTLMFLLTFAYAAMAAPLELFLSDSDAGSLITLDQTTVAVIELDSNPSTGHSWQAKQPLGQHFRIVGRTFESSQPGLRGAGGKEKIYVVGKAKGRSQLVLDYRRIHTPAISNTITYKFNTLAKFNETFSLPVQVSTIPPQLVQNKASSNLGLPIAFNWCDQNGCTPVRDQGNCGSCWAFATVGPLESLIKINDDIDVDLAEQYLVSCNDEGWGCNGGFWAHDYHEWKSVTGEIEAGAVLENDFPYQAQDLNCNPPHDKAYQIASWEYVCGNANCTPTVDEIKQAIYDHGPLTVAVCANTAMQEYSRGVFSGPSCSDLNHGVVLVGWNDNDGCWIMRNSWGSSWGESGYMRIGYGVSGIGAEASYVVYSGAPDPDPDPDEAEITDAQTISDLSANQNEWLEYFINVPEDAINLTVEISGGTGDADLYTRFGAQPDLSTYDCRPYNYGNSETCVSASPRAGVWYISLRGYTAFSGVRLTAKFEKNNPDPDVGEITNDQTISSLSAETNQWLEYYINVPENASNLTVRISNGTGDADLYSRFGDKPTASAYDCRPYQYGNSEICTHASPQAGEWYIGLHGYRAFSGVSLSAEYD